MADRVQHIRRSQFVTTYGPGSIIEGRNGPRVIPVLDFGLGKYFSHDLLEKFEILDIRMTHLMRAKIFALPTNAALKRKNTQYIYRTIEFPKWRICNDRIKHNSFILYDGGETDGLCPMCGNRGEPVRFIAACPDGHMDDVPWNFAVHGKDNVRCKGKWFYWIGGGSSMKNITIECPECNRRISMGYVFSRKWRCSGRFPEHDRYKKISESNGCESSMMVIQRQATNLRIPEVKCLLTLPNYDISTNIANVLLKRAIIELIMAQKDSGIFNQTYFIKALETRVERGEIEDISSRSIEEYIDKNGWENFSELCEHVILEGEENGHIYKDMLMEEFTSLRNSSEIGYNEGANFKIRKSKNFNMKLPKTSIELQISPVDLLRTVTVQIGYRRMPYLKLRNEPEANKLVTIKVSIPTSGEDWLPGFESRGEGIFITSRDNPLAESNQAIIEWNQMKHPSTHYNKTPSNIDVKDPLFVWWHTLSHALIKALSLYSGYSSSALRERVYFNEDERTGGILIYSAISGEDGGMGGLTGSIANFEEIISRASNLIILCSNDPLCIEHRISDRECNGAACHSCLLISETSCEYRNMWLDRHILLGD